MQESELIEAARKICRKDPRYDREAYVFMREVLDYTVKVLEKPAQGPARHVTAAELLEGVRAYALQEFGPMALTVLRSWGIARTEDFGEIVFNLVESGVLGKTAEDRKEDFANGYDFGEVFRKPFEPQSKTQAGPGPAPRGKPRKPGARPR
jgi:uncharacterized repeat protein (TIGR04138 family)